MKIRFADEKDYLQLAEMKWLHCEEDDYDYGEHNLDSVNKQEFIAEFIDFLSVIWLKNKLYSSKLLYKVIHRKVKQLCTKWNMLNVFGNILMKKLLY